MKPGLNQLAQSGATDGQVPVWDQVNGLWVPGDVVRGLTSDDHSVTITDNGDGTFDLAAAGGGGGGAIPWGPVGWNVTVGNRYFCPFNTGTSTTGATAGAMTANGFPIGRACKIRSLDLELTVASGSANTYLGIYDSTGTDGTPGNLLASAGVITSATAGFRTADFGGTPFQIDDPGFYWIVAKNDAAGGTWRAHATTVASPYLGGTNTRLAASGVATGALPATAPAMTPQSSGTGGLRIGVVIDALL